MKLKISKVLIVYTILLLIIAALGATYILYSKNYNNVYGYPSIENHTLNLENASLDNKRIPIRLYGEWEFYYNQWIVTDSEDEAIPTGTINVPEKWSGRNYNGQILPRNGFASYKLNIQNAKVGDKIIVCNDFCKIAFRVFINGELSFVTGELSKDLSKTNITGRYDYSKVYEVKSSDSSIEVVVEVSANNDGGLFKTPLLTGEYLFNLWNSVDWTANFLNYLVLGIFLVIIIMVTTFYLNLKKFGFGVIDILFVTALLLNYLTTIDTFHIVCKTFSFINFSHLNVLSLTTALTYFAILLLCFFKNKISKKMRLINIGLLLLNVSTITLYLCFSGLKYSPLFLIPSLLTILFYLYFFARSFVKREEQSLTKLIIYIISAFGVFIEFADNSGLGEIGGRTVYNYFSITLMTLLLVFFTSKLKIINSEALAKKELENKITCIKNEKIKEQIISGKLQNIKEIKIYTFGHFNVFVDDIPIRFKSAKSKELLALLVDKHGGELTIDEVITRLYPDKDTFLSKRSYRDIVIKLRNTLQEYGICELVEFERAKLKLNKIYVTYCDVWKFLEKPTPIDVDEYMLSYEWAVFTVSHLQNLIK